MERSDADGRRVGDFLELMGSWPLCLTDAAPWTTTTRGRVWRPGTHDAAGKTVIVFTSGHIAFHQSSLVPPWRI